MTRSEERTDASGAQFDFYVLFSEPITFDLQEIRDALTEDYPGLDIGTCPLLSSGYDPVASEATRLDTDAFCLGPIAMNADGGTIVTLNRLPGYGQFRAEDISPCERLMFQNAEDALAANRSYINIHASTKSIDLSDRFRAARLCTAIAAVFARLDVSVGAYWETGNHFMSPEYVAQAADQAMQDDWPLMQWICANCGWSHEYPEHGTGSTQGLSRFVDHELFFAPARGQQPTDVIHALLNLSNMVLAHGHVFGDGDTLSQDGQGLDAAMVLRRAPAGTKGFAHDTVLVFPPDGPLDHQAFLGPQPTPPVPPDERQQRRSDESFFKRLIGRIKTQ